MRHLPAPALVALIGLAAYGTILALGFVPDRGDDFRRLYFSAANWAHGSDPYAVVIGDTPNLNHPILLPVLWLFTLLSPPLAFIGWSALSLGLLVACLPPISRIARLGALDLLALILSSGGGFLTLVYGQVTFLLMAIFTAAWYADRKGRTVAAGALLGLLTVLKPFFGLFAIYLAWRRQWRGLAVYATVFVAGTLAGWAIVGTPGFAAWIVKLRDVQWRWHIYNASVWGVGDRLFTMHPYSESWTPLVDFPQLANVVTLFLLIVVVVILVRSLRPADIDSSYALLGVASLLLSPLGWLYYLPAFLGPIIAVLGERPARRLGIFVALTVWPYLLLVGPFRGQLGTLVIGEWAFATVVGLFLMIVLAIQPRPSPLKRLT